MVFFPKDGDYKEGGRDERGMVEKEKSAKRNEERTVKKRKPVKKKFQKYKKKRNPKSVFDDDD